jgi:adenosylcobinamide-GDP ribazoletransferase
MLNSLYLGFKFSLSHFSILPISFKKNDDLSHKDVLGTMLLTMPLVGLILGIITVFIFSLLSSLEWYGAILSAVVYMILYGFIHTEAVIDVTDALYASHSSKDAYKIIKEPTVGAMGVLYAVAVILVKISGITFLLMHHLFFEFIAVLIISRLSLVVLFRVHTFKSSFATELKASLSNGYLIASFLIFIFIGSLLTFEFILFLIEGVLLALIISYAIKLKLGFINGDVLGTTLEGVESVLFLLISLLLVK